jgi:hypothetical protein
MDFFFLFFVGCAHENGRDTVVVRYDRAVIKIIQMTRGRSVASGFILGDRRKVLRLVDTDPGPKILRDCTQLRDTDVPSKLFTLCPEVPLTTTLTLPSSLA